MAFWNVFTKKKSAHEYIAAGNFKAALKVIEEQLQEKKSDPVLRMQAADLHLKLGNREQAKKLYIQVGSYYGDQGFFNKAVASFKKALNISPNDEKILKTLSTYNNKVPKYILDTNFFNGQLADEPAAIADEEKQPSVEPAVEETPVAAEENEDAPIELAAPETVDEFPLPDPDKPDLPDPTQTEFKEELPTGNAFEEADIDFDTLSDLSEELSAQFEKASPNLKGGELAEQPSNPLDISIHDPGDFATNPDLSSVIPDSPSEVQPENPPKSKVETRVEKAVFSSRSLAAKEDAKDDGDNMFSSLDQALDSLFAAEPSAPSKSREENKKHWALFRTMPDDVVQAFIIALEQRDIQTGSYVVEQGQTGDEMFLIAMGEVEVILNDERVATLGEGDFFGEASLLTGAPRNASVKVIQDVSCLVLKKKHLQELSRSHPSVMEGMITIYKARQRQNKARQH